MRSSTHSYLDRAGEQTRLLVETLLEMVPGTEIVALMTDTEASIPGFELEPMVGADSKKAFEEIGQRVRVQLSGGAPIGSFSFFVHGVEWGVLVEPIEIQGREIGGVLVIARHGRTWSVRERSLVKMIGSLLSGVSTLAKREDALLRQRRLDQLVALVADRLMSASAASRQEVLNWVCEVLADFLHADVCILRRQAGEYTILEAEWPIREDKPDPDPLGTVRFDADPIFMAMKDLKSPYLDGFEDQTDEYLNRAQEGSGVIPANGAAVPLLIGDATWGILGFIHFELHAWDHAEIEALKAVASMLVQLQARIDAEQQRSDAEEQTRHNANHDDLTGLPNRRALINELKTRLAEKRATAVMVIDLDRFKVMNDYLGHGSGDEMLRTIADRIQLSKRDGDFAARLGGDEFVFFIDNVDSGFQAASTAQRILELVSQPVTIAGQQVSHTASIGIAIADEDSLNELEMLGFADVAMYEAKKNGGNRFHIFDRELREREEERSKTELMLREAIEKVGLRLHFQPEVNIETGELLAVEALVRWQHPERGLLAAAEFINIAEETGLVSQMGRWVFAEACRQLAQWQEEFPDRHFVVRVNMSPVDFRTDDLVLFVERCLHANRVPGERLCIEVTEYAVLHDYEETARTLEAFQALGLEIALDDFGTGTASMTELKYLPVDFLKLDMSFVRGIADDAYDQAIVESIIRLGKALNLGVIAEGIESGRIVDKLIELGCHRGQGYLISRPVAPSELADIVRNGCIPTSTLHPIETVPADLADLSL